jgi:hypothetical protein
LNFFSAWQQSERVSVHLAARGTASKRPLQEDESTLAPKAKRAKAKSKSATPRSTSASGAVVFYITLQTFSDTHLGRVLSPSLNSIVDIFLVILTF